MAAQFPLGLIHGRCCKNAHLRPMPLLGVCCSWLVSLQFRVAQVWISFHIPAHFTPTREESFLQSLMNGQNERYFCHVLRREHSVGLQSAISIWARSSDMECWEWCAGACFRYRERWRAMVGIAGMAAIWWAMGNMAGQRGMREWVVGVRVRLQGILARRGRSQEW